MAPRRQPDTPVAPVAEIEELDFLIEYRGKLVEFHDAKAAAKAAPGDVDAEARWQAAKLDLREYRSYWRQIRAAVGRSLADGDAVASPAAVALGLEGSN